MESDAFRALALHIQGLTQAVTLLCADVRELLVLARAAQADARQPHPLSRALVGLVDAMAKDVWAPRILLLSLVVALFCFLTVPVGSPLYPVLDMLGQWAHPAAGAAP